MRKYFQSILLHSFSNLSIKFHSIAFNFMSSNLTYVHCQVIVKNHKLAGLNFAYKRVIAINYCIVTRLSQGSLNRGDKEDLPLFCPL